MEQNLIDLTEDLKKEFDISSKTAKTISEIGKYDLSFLVKTLNDDLIRLGRDYSCEQAYPLIRRYGKADERLAKRLEFEFKRFCILCVINPEVPHAPPGAVDMFWHFFILHTDKYIDFCEKVWGDFEGAPKIRHHYPSTDETRAGMLEAYNATRDLYVKVFGEPEDYKMDSLPGAPPLTSRPIWIVKSDTSGDSFSGIIEPRKI